MKKLVFLLTLVLMPSTTFCSSNGFSREKQKNQDAPLTFIQDNPEILAIYWKILISKFLITRKHSSETDICLLKKMAKIVNDSSKKNNKKITELCNLISCKNSPSLNQSTKDFLSTLIQKIIRPEVRVIPDDSDDNLLMYSKSGTELGRFDEDVPLLSDSLCSS